MIITEKKTVYGWLYTDFGNYQLLSPYPNKHDVPWYFKDEVFSFFVVGKKIAGDFGITIFVRGDFLIEPFSELVEVDVQFVVSDDGPEPNKFPSEKEISIEYS